ncbi:hypothetical protein G4B88_000779 [Cannabis sativa]|uniref:DUF4283 domain-containing protein n=1 Tax=Cannabis sativa TaxID=3483 RepID=A0A7J6I3U9_CANSA|nr:hypothetical protein G4B88_000779 [Cannabis sativa]
MDSSGISNLFEEAIQISPDDITFTLNPGEVDEPQETNQVLLGKIIHRYKFEKAAIQGSLNLSWKAVKGWRWKEIEDGLLQFTFAKREDAMNVLARRPWFVCGALMVLMPWAAWLTPAEVRFDKTPMWVNVESIPPFYWNLSNLKEMAAKASPVYELPSGIEDAVGLSTLRFRATIDINKPIFSPTVVKDSLGNYYPLYGTWLRNDVKEKSTFTTPLAKWFKDWVLQKRLGKDPFLCNQIKVQKAIRNGEEADMRECRMQLPSKRRIFSDSDEENEENTPAMVITQLPMVYLPGIGKISPFGQNSKQVNVQELIDAATPSENKRTKMFAIKGSNSNGNTQSDNDSAMIQEDLTISMPSLFNPILNIEDFRVQEHLEGPRKRKASDGIVLSPLPVSINETTAPSLIEEEDKTKEGTFNDSHTVPTSYKDSSNNSQPTARITQSKFYAICSKLNFTGIHYIPPVGLSRGLGLCWLKGVQCKILSANKFVIFGEISSDPPGEKWLVLVTYGPPHATDKEEFWRSLGDLVLLATIPILIIGDLNGTLQDSVCINYANNGNSSCYAFDFRRMVNPTGLIDLGFDGPGYTWSRGNVRSPGAGSLKRARLDRGLASTDWRILFLAAIVNHLSSSVSDHRPIILDTNGGVMCKDMARLFIILFADDIMLFGQASTKEAKAFKDCLATYCEWSGQSINQHKSSVHFSCGVPRGRIQAITEILRMKKMTYKTTYLGLPLFTIVKPYGEWLRAQTRRKNYLLHSQYLRTGTEADVQTFGPREPAAEVQAENHPLLSMETMNRGKEKMQSVDAITRGKEKLLF